MKKDVQDSKKQAKELEELKRVDEELWREIVLLARSLADRQKAEKKLNEFGETHRVKTLGEYILGLRELTMRLQQLRLEGQVEYLRDVLKTPPVEMPKSMDEVLARRILLLVASNEQTETETYISDRVIAAVLKADLGDVQRELLILGVNELLDLDASVAPSFGARITDAGRAKSGWLKTTPKPTAQ